MLRKRRKYLADLKAKVARPGVVGPELGLEAFPGDPVRFLDIAHLVGEPRVEIDREGRAHQLLDGSQIDGFGRTRNRFEDHLTQLDLGTPYRPSREKLLRQAQSHEGQPDGARSPQPEGVVAIDPVDSVVLGTAVRKGGEDEDVGYEADRLGLDIKLIASSWRRTQCPGPVPDFVSHS